MLRTSFKTTCIMLLMTFALAMTACNSQPTLDFSSDEAAVKSIQAVSEKLPTEDQQRFKTAMGKIITSITNETFSESTDMAEAYPVLKSRIYEALNGKTALEVIERGESM